MVDVLVQNVLVSLIALGVFYRLAEKEVRDFRPTGPIVEEPLPKNELHVIEDALPGLSAHDVRVDLGVVVPAIGRLPSVKVV